MMIVMMERRKGREVHKRMPLLEKRRRRKISQGEVQRKVTKGSKRIVMVILKWMTLTKSF